MVVVAVACILVFGVFHDDIFGDDAVTETTLGAAVSTTVDADSTTGGSTTTSADGTTDSTGSGIATTSSSSTGGGSTAATPEEAVLRTFEAMENKDLEAYMNLFDPVALEEALGGLPLEEMMADIGDSMFEFESIEFSDVELDTEKTGDTTATVTVVGGTVTITNLDGTTETEDVTQAGEPIFFDVIQRDGVWYLDPMSMFGGV